MDIAVVIPVQQGGNDLIRDALAPFGNSRLPLVWKIRQLKELLPAKQIYVSTNSEEIKSTVKPEGVHIHHRGKDLAEESQGPIGDVISSVVNDIPHRYIAWVSSVVPFMSEYDYRKALKEFEDNVIGGAYDSLIAVHRIYDYLWDEQGPINYNADKFQPKRAGLPITYRVTNGLFIREKSAILEDDYYVGSNPYKSIVSKLSGLDINAEEDFAFASALSELYTEQKKSRDRVVFLDFDGVVFDSAIEAYAMAMLTSKKVKRLSELDLDSDHTQRFLAQRYLIGPAWNYYYLLAAIDHGLDEEFEDYLPSQPGEDAKEFQVAFFATRQVIRNNFWDEWLSLNILYEGAEAFIDLINANNNVVIVTTKDQATVKALLDCHGLQRAVEIFDSKSYEKFGGKSNFMDDYMQSNFLSRAIFIDDSQMHLDKCSWVENLTTLRARWGYVETEQRADNMQEVLHKIREFLGS